MTVKDSFLLDQTTHALAEQTNACLQDAVRRDGKAYVQHLDSFIVALREELDSPGGLNARNPHPPWNESHIAWMSNTMERELKARVGFEPPMIPKKKTSIP